MARPRDLLMVIPSLAGGGAERVFVTLANYLDRRRFRVGLVTLLDRGPLAAELKDDVELHELGKTRAMHSLLPLARLVRGLRPSIVFSCLPHANTAVLLVRPLLPRNTVVIVRQGTLLSIERRQVRNPFVFGLLSRVLYRKADKIVTQCDAMLEDCVEPGNLPREKLVRIYNPVNGEAIRTQAGTRSPYPQHGGRNILGVGTLKPAKGFDRLIAAFARAAGKDHLWILGEGPLRPELEAQARTLDVADRVHLPGFRSDTATWMAHADLFVLSSNYDGLPNALLEAIAAGCPVLARRCPGGTAEVMELCGLRERLVEEIRIEERCFDRGDSSAAAERLRANFDATRIAEQYAGLFDSAGAT